jgi:hypothetical protein
VPDRFLEWAVIILPTLFAVMLEIVSEGFRKNPRWRYSVAAFGLIVSALTWFQIARARKSAETDRQQIIIGIAKAISKEMKEGVPSAVTTAIVQYNEAHPQNPVTSQQFAALISKLRSSDSPATPGATVTSTNKSANAPLTALASRQIGELTEICGPWAERDKGYGDMIYDLQINSTHLPETENTAAIEAAERSQDEEARSFQDRIIRALSDAVNLQSTLLPGIDKQTQADKNEKQNLNALLESNIRKMPKDASECPRYELEDAAQYLDTLVARAK